MKSFYRQNQPEIETDLIFKTVNSLKFSNFEKFGYQGHNFTIILCTQNDIDTSEDKRQVFYSELTLGNFDLYILKTLPTAEKRKRIFHEVIEAILKTQGYENQKAHELASIEMNKYFI